MSPYTDFSSEALPPLTAQLNSFCQAGKSMSLSEAPVLTRKSHTEHGQPCSAPEGIVTKVLASPMSFFCVMLTSSLRTACQAPVPQK